MVSSVPYPDVISYSWIGMGAQNNKPKFLKTSPIFLNFD